MGSLSSKDIVMRAWAAFGSGDPARVRAVLTDDAEWLAPAGNATALAVGGTHHMVGRDRIVHFLTHELPTVFVDISVELHHVFADGDTVIVEESTRATLAHGGHYENDYCFVFELEDGRIRRVREYMDTARGAACFTDPGLDVPTVRH